MKALVVIYDVYNGGLRSKGPYIGIYKGVHEADIMNKAHAAWIDKHGQPRGQLKIDIQYDNGHPITIDNDGTI
jgi:hypothetical protein